MKATLYTEVFGDTEKGIALLEKLQTDFPETERGKHAAQMIAALKKQAELGVGKTFPDFNEKSLNGEPLSIAKYKGNIVLVDFWATWCGPCIAELPNVLNAYKKHHDQGFEIIGISLDSDRDKLTSFIKEKGMTWPQYFDGQGWQTKLAQDYGINSIPATFLLDGNGTIIAKDLRGDDLEQKVAAALANK
jgi:peroxiredoxin